MQEYNQLAATVYAEPDAEQIKMFNNSKVGNLTTFESNNESQVKVLSIELFDEYNSTNTRPPLLKSSKSPSPISKQDKYNRMQKLANEANRLHKKQLEVYGSYKNTNLKSPRTNHSGAKAIMKSSQRGQL